MRGLKMETKITKLDKPTVKYLRERLRTIVKPLAKELGIAIDLDNCTFAANNCRFQLKVALLDNSGKAITEDADCFRDNAKLFGFEPDDLGRKFSFQGQPYTICGLKPKSHKYPVIARSADGKNYKFPCRTVLSALGRKVSDWL
jgi:hypothetical protein